MLTVLVSGSGCPSCPEPPLAALAALNLQPGLQCARSVPAECPQEVVDLYLRCLSSAPAERPSAADIVDMLQRVGRPPGKGKPVQAQGKPVQAQSTAA